MTSHTLLGFDYGTKHIGIAVGQTITHTATALETLTLRNNQPDWEAISRLVTEWQPQAFVIGLPRRQDGSESAVSRAARRFGQQLHGRYHLPVHTMDEHLSSHAAAQLIDKPAQRRARGAIDKFAAQVILQTWLNHPTSGPVA